MPRAALPVLFAAILLLLIAACHEPPGYPETGCNAQCNARASAFCSEDDCARGCRFVLDRLVEHEGPNVVACVSKSNPKDGCGDPVWADCAVRVGVHADGGPPPPYHAPAD
jgi:hypothetical protein